MILEEDFNISRNKAIKFVAISITSYAVVYFIVKKYGYTGNPLNVSKIVRFISDELLIKGSLAMMLICYILLEVSIVTIDLFIKQGIDIFKFRKEIKYQRSLLKTLM